MYELLVLGRRFRAGSRERVLLTGATGFIGKHLLPVLLGGYDVVGISRTSEGLEQMKSDGLSNDRVFICDLTELKSIDRVVEKCPDIQHIVHLSGNVPTIADDWVTAQLQIDSHLTAAMNLSKAIPHLRYLKTFVYASSIAVYGNPGLVPVDEDYPTNPQTFYGVCKWGAERYLGLRLRSAQVRYVSFRIGYVYGDDNPHPNALSSFIKAAREGNPLVLRAGDAVFRDYVHVSDVTGSILHALRDPRVSGTYNVGSGSGISIPELARIVQRHKYVPVLRDESPDQQPSICVMDNTKWKNSYGGFRPLRISDAVEELLRA